REELDARLDTAVETRKPRRLARRVVGIQHGSEHIALLGDGESPAGLRGIVPMAGVVDLADDAGADEGLQAPSAALVADRPIEVDRFGIPDVDLHAADDRVAAPVPVAPLLAPQRKRLAEVGLRPDRVVPDGPSLLVIGVPDEG